MGTAKLSLVADRPDTSGEHPEVARMCDWFFRCYEDPVHSCPVDGGEFVFIFGGPYFQGDVLHEHFSGVVEELHIERAVSLIGNFGFDWAPRESCGFGEVFTMGGVQCLMHTDLAVLVRAHGDPRKVWVPRSQVMPTSEVKNSGDSGVFRVSLWLARREGWAP